MSGIRTAAIFSAMLCVAACGGGDSGGVPNADSSRTDAVAEQPSNSTELSAEFMIESLPLDLAADIWQWPVDEGTWPARDRPPVHIFGKDYQGKVEATLMFDMLKVGTTVLSPISGQVVDVRQQPDSCDVELYIGDGSAPPDFARPHRHHTPARRRRDGGSARGHCATVAVQGIVRGIRANGDR